MPSLKIEQRVNLKFLVKLNKTATESFCLLKQVYGEQSLSRSQVFEWHRRFKEGREDVEDDEHSGRPRTSRTDEKVKKIRKIVKEYRGISIRAVAEMVNINKESVRQILHENDIKNK